MTLFEINENDHVQTADGYNYSVYYKSNRTNMYFSQTLYYENHRELVYEHNSLKHISNEQLDIVRVERKSDNGEYYPIWTRVDGDILDSEGFLNINGKNYTRKFVEELFTQMTKLNKDLCTNI